MTVTIPDWVWYLLIAVVFAFLLWFGWAMARITADSDRRIAQMDFEPDTSADIDVAIFNVTDRPALRSVQ